MSMLIRHEGEDWHEPAGRGYSNEAHLQQVLANHPALIPGVGADASVCSEFQSGVGPADIVAVDPDGTLTLIECKLAANREVRREVVGQVLDYAARLWRMPVDQFDAQWRLRMQVSLFDQDESGELRRGLEASLNEGRFRIVLAVDDINDDLRRIVEYLNAITLASTAVIAVVYSRLHDGGTELLQPRTYGEELAGAKALAEKVNRPTWTADDYLAWVRVNDPHAADAAGRLLEFLDQSGFRVAGGSATTPSLNVAVSADGRTRWPMALYTYRKGACIEFRVADYKTTEYEADQYAQLVASLPGTPLTIEELRANGYRNNPNVAVAGLVSADMNRVLRDLHAILTQPPVAAATDGSSRLAPSPSAI